MTFLEHATIKKFGRFALYLPKLVYTLLHFTVSILKCAIEYYTVLCDTVLYLYYS